MEKIKLHHIRNNIPVWKHWKDLSDCTEREKGVANLQSIPSDIILLDLENKKQLPRVLKKLIGDDYAFELYFTGSRGFHITLKFPEMVNYSKEQRNKIREFFIKKYGADLTKKSEDTLFAIPDKPHFKTGVLKVLLATYGETKNNQLPKEAIEYGIKEDVYITDPLTILNGSIQRMEEKCKAISRLIKRNDLNHIERQFLLFNYMILSSDGEQRLKQIMMKQKNYKQRVTNSIIDSYKKKGKKCGVGCEWAIHNGLCKVAECYEH